MVLITRDVAYTITQSWSDDGIYSFLKTGKRKKYNKDTDAQKYLSGHKKNNILIKDEIMATLDLVISQMITC